MNRILLLSTLPSLLLFAACQTPPSQSMSGPPGVRTSMSGIDFWHGGPPNRPYRVIQTTVRQGPDTSASYEDEEALLAGDATARGADAVIVLDRVMSVARVNQENGALIKAPKVDAQLIQYK